MVRVGAVEVGLTAGGKEEGREKSCCRVLAPMRVLGRAKGRGAFEKLGAVLGEYNAGVGADGWVPAEAPR